METFVDLLQGFAWGVFRLIVGISGLVAFTYFAFFLVSIVRGSRPAGTIRHSNMIGVMCLFLLTGVGLAFVANALHFSGWDTKGRGAIPFYALVVMLSVTAGILAVFTAWKVTFSSDGIVEHRSFGRKKSVKWIDVVSWSLSDEARSMIIRIRDGRFFSIFLADVDGAQELFDTLEARGIPREDLESPAEAKP